MNFDEYVEKLNFPSHFWSTSLSRKYTSMQFFNLIETFMNYFVVTIIKYRHIFRMQMYKNCSRAKRQSSQPFMTNDIMKVFCCEKQPLNERMKTTKDSCFWSLLKKN